MKIKEIRPPKPCHDCEERTRLGHAEPTKGFYDSVETLKGRKARTYKTLIHRVRLTREIKKTGNCITLYEAETACGVFFSKEVDSSD